ncbi:MAG: hypothetical protein HYU66_20555 [Armatimonadetes bacterium]|nr:hypothetical protein [Armatimonadota bacterium]
MRRLPAIAAILLVGTLAGVFLLRHWPSWQSRRRFDAAVWRQYSGSSDWKNPRGPMVRDLQRRHLRVGTRRADILALLGKPDSGDKPRLVSYRLGAWSRFRMDPDTLDLYFDAQGRLTRTDVVQH